MNRDEAAELGGGVSARGTWAWLFRGSVLEVAQADTGRRVASWTFTQGIVEHVTEVFDDARWCYLAVALNTGSGQDSLLALFDPARARVAYYLRVPQAITSLAHVPLSRVTDPRARTGVQVPQNKERAKERNRKGRQEEVMLRVAACLPFLS